MHAMTINIERLKRHAVNYQPYTYDLPEAERARRLWVFVIVQAVKDALAPPHDLGDGEANERILAWRRGMEDERRRAREWLQQPNADFELVCDRADLDPEFVRDRACFLIKTHDQLTRMVRSFHTFHHHGGWSGTFADALGTGGGRHAHDFAIDCNGASAGCN